MLIDEYLYIKRRHNRRKQNLGNNLLKLTTLYLQRNQHNLQSKNIPHMDNIIEEYVDFDYINEEILMHLNQWTKDVIAMPNVPHAPKPDTDSKLREPG